MIQVKTKQDLLPKSRAPRREEMSTIQAKNTLLHLNGQNLKLAAKNGGHSKAPGLHLSPLHGKEAAGRLTASPQLTQEGTPQLDLLLPRSHRLVLDTRTENQPVRRPLKLAPLDLSEEVQQEQKQKLKSSCNVNKPSKLRTCVNQGREKDASIEPFKAEKKPPKPQLRSIEEVVCQGTPAPLLPKLTPNSPYVKARSKVSTGQNLTNQDNTSKRRLRLTRGQCLEEDEAKSNMSTAALCPHEDKLARGAQSKGQLQDRASKGSPQSGKSIRGLPVAPQENRCVKKSSTEDRKLMSETCTLNLPRDRSSEPEGVKPGATSWGLKRKKALMTRHNKTLTLERLQL